MTTTPTQPEHNVSFEHQRQLAKLLAKENIRVRQGNYKTAFFDVKNRVLGLPTWNLESKDVSDLLVGHEVGHARWTPEDGVSQYHERFGKSAPFDIANVVEDIRIEKHILSAFPGLVSSFTKGYTHLFEKDFFRLNDRNIDELNFIDRLNLKGKLRNLVDVQFDEWETEIYNKCLRANTYQEVLDICGEIIGNLPKEKPEPQQENPEEETPAIDEENSREEGGDDDSMDFGQNPPEEETQETDPSSDQPQESDESESSQPSSSSGDEDGYEDGDDTDSSTSDGVEGGDDTDSSTSDAVEGGDDIDYSNAISETQRALDEELENTQEDWDGTLYVDAPTHEQIAACVSSLDTVREKRKEKLSQYNTLMTCPIGANRWNRFKKDSKKNVSLLVREFERKKSAYEYSRSQTSATGSIDPNKLHSYKYDDQIFKSVTKLATSKDHGMVFFVDWSGSMHKVLHDVIQQTLQLAFFCKAVGIPFAVYGFTTGWSGGEVPTSVGDVVDLEGASVFELLNSSIGKREFEDACKELFIGSKSYTNAFSSTLEHLGGTPLFDTIICAADIVNRFRAQHNVQKLHTLFLTDGESKVLNYREDKENKSFEKPSGEGAFGKPQKQFLRWGNSLIGPDIFRSRGKLATYRQLILNFKKITGSSAICFFLGDGRMAKCAAIAAITHSSKFKASNWYEATEEYKVLRRKTLKDKSRTIFIEDGLGYDGYFVIDSNKVKIEDIGLSADANIDCSKASDVNQLARKFSTQSREKRASRVFLTKFSDLIS